MLKILPTNDKQKLKLKKNANEYVDVNNEKKNDPKYKTELCRSWSENGFCVYGNKCRFAHGKHEMFEKPINLTKYRQKDCNSFKENGFCMYGSRCNFKHDNRKLEDIERSYYLFLLSQHKECENNLNMNKMHFPSKFNSTKQKRLRIFNSIAAENNTVQVASPYLNYDVTAENGQKSMLNYSCFHPLMVRLY
jgi:hypothetical protein